VKETEIINNLTEKEAVEKATKRLTESLDKLWEKVEENPQIMDFLMAAIEKVEKQEAKAPPRRLK
jgi:hypothetical protein